MSQRILFLVVSVVLIASLWACGGTKRLPNPADTMDPALGFAPPKSSITFEEMMAMEEEETSSYRLGPGDTITIYVYGEESLTRTVTIEPNGNFTFPLVGEVIAKNRRVAEIIEELDVRLNTYLKGAKTDIIINEFSSNDFVILGDGVKKPGIHQITGEIRILKAIAMAGGLRTVTVNELELPGADLQRSYLSRNGEVLPIDFPSLIVSGDMRYNIRVRPRDILYIPVSTSREILILGAVRSPSVVPLLRPMTLTKAIAVSGGFLPAARTSRVRIVRNAVTKPEVFEVDMDDILEGKGVDFVLEPNDIVYVPESVF